MVILLFVLVYMNQRGRMSDMMLVLDLMISYGLSFSTDFEVGIFL